MANLLLLPREEQDLVSAVRRTFIISVRPKGFAGKGLRVLVINAFSVSQAKHAAVRKLAVKADRHRKFDQWKFESVEEANGEQGNGGGA